MAGANKQRIEPGYCIVDTPGSLSSQGAILFRNPHSETARYFMRLNADTPWLKPGQILVVADPDSTMTGQMLRTLRQVKQRVNNDLVGVNTDDASFFQRNYGMIAGLTSAGDKIFGAAGDAGEKYFKAIETTLNKIETTYQNQFRTQGTLIGQQFFVERNRLLAELRELVNKPLVKSLARHSVKFRPYEDMRRALNLSSRSIVHEWSTVGVGAIPGYATYTSSAAKAAKFLKYGGYIGIGFSFLGTSNDVVHACTTGRENECGKVAFKEYTKFGVGTLSGVGAGYAGSIAGMAVCTAVGVVTAGVGGVACASVGALVGGALGTGTSDYILDRILD